MKQFVFDAINLDQNVLGVQEGISKDMVILSSLMTCLQRSKGSNISFGERDMHKFKSMRQAQRFLNAHAAVYNLFNLDRHLVSAKNFRYFRPRAFAMCGLHHPNKLG